MKVNKVSRISSSNSETPSSVQKRNLNITNWFRNQFCRRFGDRYCGNGSHSKRFCSSDNPGGNRSCWSNRFNNPGGNRWFGSNRFNNPGSNRGFGNNRFYNPGSNRWFCGFGRCNIRCISRCIRFSSDRFIFIGFVRFRLLYFPVVAIKEDQ